MLLQLFVLWAPVISCYGQTTSRLPDFSNLEFYQSTEQDLRAVEEANQRYWASNAAKQKDRNTNSPPRWRTAFTAQIQAARALVTKAEAAQAAYNKWNIENPRFNVYGHKGAAGSDSGPQRRDPANDMAKLHMTGPCLLAGIRLTKFGETSRTTAPKAMELQMTAQLSKGQSRTGTDAAPTAQARPSSRLLYTFHTVLVFVCSA